MKADAQIPDKKIELIQWLSSLDDEATIEKLIQFRINETTGWWDKISNEEKISLEEGIEDANNKKLNTHSSARKLYEKWL